MFMVGAVVGADRIGGVEGWLTRQATVRTWSAELRQTRRLKSLAEPLATPGRVWFKAPNLFRWELGDPVRTIAIREPDRLVLLYPRLKRAEIYPLTGEERGPWRSSLALLEVGFPRDRGQLESQFVVVSESAREGTVELALEPKEAGARRWITRVEVTFDAAQLGLLATELHFTDGSTLRNEFTDTVINPPLEDDRLRADIPADFTVVLPTQGR
jgi:outer membrane lipoprotein-sorting protein